MYAPRSTAAVLITVLALALHALAAEPASQPRHKPAAPDTAPEAPIVPLGKTVELTFSVKNDDTQKINITCATQSYACFQQYDGAEDSNQTSVSGDLRLVDGRDDAVLVTFHFVQSYTGQEDSGDVDVSGSAVVPFGKEVRLAGISDTAFYVEAKEIK